ncbi:ventrally expressed gene D protein [Scaptodrosophila lebanonensis]|uniref:Ventrally expressed gene D protein n=1 Tax=Drosophila lebanonensis TaxID=7225 RepID=A0A6J2UMJ3_DROLE|nr:ventrally expressed gene D protein [Scaptodrosophila lebanonensis]
MIPETDNNTTANICWDNATIGCNESRCGQSETAAEVYRRIVDRLQMYPSRNSLDNAQSHASKLDEDQLRRIWIASFTGSSLFYRS